MNHVSRWIACAALVAGVLHAQVILPSLTAPASSPIGAPIPYALSLPPTTSYVLEVSFAGTSPGITFVPGNVHFPLNPPYLHYDLGALLPGIFVNFVGSSDAAGNASAVVNVPYVPALIGLTLSASFVVLDAQAPLGISAAAGPVDTAIVGPPPLVLSYVFPPSAPPGAPIVVHGSGMQLGAVVTVGGLLVPIVSLTATSLTFTNPPNPQCDTVVTVLNPDGQFAYLPFSLGPVITSPVGSGPASGGFLIGILGSEFHPGTTVTIGGAPALLIYLAPDALVVMVPPGTPGPAPVVVSSAAGCTAVTTFLYQ